MTHSSDAPGLWLDRFFDAYYAAHPVNASFVGVRGYDHRLPDLSESGAGDLLASCRALLDEPPDGIRDTQALDVDLATGFLRLRAWEVESGHMHRFNPSFHVGEAVFGVMAHLLTEYAPFPQRAEAVIARLHATPAFLGQARETVREAPRPWVERAARECRSALAFLQDGLPRTGAPDASRGGLAEAARPAARAYSDFLAYLENDVRAPEGWEGSIGEEAFALHLREAHAWPESPAEVLVAAEADIEEAQRDIQERAEAMGAASPADLLARLRTHRPSADEYLERYRREWLRIREFALEHELVTWPEFPIEYVERPEWARAAAPGLYFLFYRAPAAYDRPAVHRYLVAPLPEKDSEHEEFLSANNDSVIRLNHVIHHGGIGHHVQNWHAYRASSRVGRIAAVDCASRIAMHCGATMAEGWACYATDLVREFGGLTPLEDFAERNGRVRMLARTIVDVSFHTGRMTFDQAVDYYRRVAGMPEGAARSEATKNAMFPCAALIYSLGSDAIHRLRGEMMSLRPDWSIRDFHDAFLSYGSVPVARIARAMKQEATLEAE